ncbi:DUF3945 domain-containing protein [Evansella clarkii]|uniref:DUF3945 domain-containing protein n=1 Tax=Evansella clarkii TaxID=79879 RepID=UPI000996E117|nr:DUF3945 domain-containing protein [Evansella clarkii]
MTFLLPTQQSSGTSEPDNYDAEYVHMCLPNGEAVRFKRVWSGYRFTDREIELLIAGYDIRIKTAYTDGITGSLEWQEHNGHEYFGFAPWDAAGHDRKDAPFPIQWNGHNFTEEEQQLLRRGEKLLLVCQSNRSLTPYAVNVSFGFIPENGPYPARWGIIPHFEEFDQPAEDFTRETCVFLPIFSGKTLPLRDIEQLRKGKSVPFSGLSRNGRPFRCRLTLELDETTSRWRLTPNF